jgi:hypothetical protein
MAAAIESSIPIGLLLQGLVKIFYCYIHEILLHNADNLIYSKSVLYLSLDTYLSL